ncbi:hypothetical protein HW450_06570 [Corynebacterium hindlerae]|uniref:Uncharacterized protein n=1 Tax=Corynebacterium hindlerae TaxID=699041 RepID=A0A7G5FIB3_9CORY|nr:hypothetical protein [Corynebacterium hindlerae]QMV86354.1 hypothetical protein HW450_06570 [Corynebacterium hindlerae]
MSKQILIDEEILRELLWEKPSEWAKKEARKALTPPPAVGTKCTHEKWGNVIVLDVLDNSIVTVFAKDRNPELITLDVSELKFHPTTLFTVSEFEAAPEGTIVDNASAMMHLRMKDSGYWLCDDEGNLNTSTEMPKYGPWYVIRWGQGNGVA